MFSVPSSCVRIAFDTVKVTNVETPKSVNTKSGLVMPILDAKEIFLPPFDSKHLRLIGIKLKNESN